MTKVTGIGETVSVYEVTLEEVVAPSITKSVSTQLDESPFMLHWILMLKVVPSSTVEATRSAVVEASTNVTEGSKIS